MAAASKALAYQLVHATETMVAYIYIDLFQRTPGRFRVETTDDKRKIIAYMTPTGQRERVGFLALPDDKAVATVIDLAVEAFYDGRTTCP